MIGDALETAYAELDALPASLFVAVVAHPSGEVRTRARGVLAWRKALLCGTLPTAPGWPEPEWTEAVGGSLITLGLLRFTAGEPDLVDLVLLDVLDRLAEEAASRDADIQAHLRALREKERRDWDPAQEPAGPAGGGTSLEVERAQTGESRGAGGEAPDHDRASFLGEQQGGETPGEGEVDPAHAARLRDEAKRLAISDGIRRLSDRLDRNWSERAEAWRRLADVLADLKTSLALGFDLAQRVLRHVGWSEIPKLQAILATAPQLQAIVRSLGRMAAAGGADRASVTRQVVDPLRRVTEELRHVRSPRAPTEARGIERSGDLARMLPVEAALLTRPALRRLWHARRAESALVAYRLEGSLLERVRVVTTATPTDTPASLKPERGPVIVCLDTSGSMQGAPEQAAKALTLAVARAAHDEGRPCFVIAFSGPGDVARHEVDLGPRGIDGLLGLLAMSYSGGTDLDWPLRVALDLLEEGAYRHADVLLVSDGGFAVSENLTRRVDETRVHTGSKIHGLLVGVQPSPAMEALCSPLHRFVDWAAVGGVDGRA
jgi:uncharacterized protein with von Willebrand factor type A (vWA) domain